jgi:hypothetical protein
VTNWYSRSTRSKFRLGHWSFHRFPELYLAIGQDHPQTFSNSCSVLLRFDDP